MNQCSECLAELTATNFVPGTYEDVYTRTFWGANPPERRYYCKDCWAKRREAEREESERVAANRRWLAVVALVLASLSGLAWFFALSR